MDRVDGLDIGSHVLNPGLQVISRVVGDVVDFRPVSGLALRDVELSLGAGLVHQVVPKNGGILPAGTAAGSAVIPQKSTHMHSVLKQQQT